MTISLSELGLNKYEERVYLTLIEEGISSAKNISDITGIPYGKVYEVMNNLSSKGFLVILPSKPMKFQAVSPKEAVLNAKKNMQEKLEKLEGRMVKELEPVFAKTKKFLEPKSLFWMINGRANVNNKIEELIKKSKYPCFSFTLKTNLNECISRDKKRKKEKRIGPDRIKDVFNLVMRFDYGKIIDTNNKTPAKIIKEIISYLPQAN